MEKKQLATEWLMEQLYEKIEMSGNGNVLDDLLEQAKLIERKQHGETWDKALDAGQDRAWNVMRAYSDFDDYFYETYKPE